MATAQKRYAVIVGVSDYEADDQIAKLPCAKNDAVRIHEDLIKCGGFDADRSYLLVNGVDCADAITPTKGNLFQRMKYVCESALEDDLIVFFFAGHGAEISKNPYLLTSDTMMDVVQQTAVKITDLNEMLERSKAKCIVRVFDACRSPFAETRCIFGGMTRGLQDALLKTGRGWASFSSCSSGEVAHESGELEHGIFSYYVCEGIEGKAANDKGEVTFDRLVDYVKTSVGNWSDKQSQPQTPHVQSDLSGQLVLASLLPARVTAVPESQNPLDMLRLGIDKHLSQTPEDTRNLTFTDEKEYGEVFQLVEGAVGHVLQPFSHPSLTIDTGQKQLLNKIGGPPWQIFTEDVRQNRVKSEEKPPTYALQIRFSSSEVVVPRTTLTLCVSRFSFFYWLWYLHECAQKQLQGSFVAEPGFKKGFFTFKAKAALDGRKMENTVKELFKRAGEDILGWADQLAEFVDGRLKPLREMGKIVE